MPLTNKIVEILNFDQVENENIQKDKKAVTVIKKTHITKIFLSFLYYKYGEDTEIHKIKWHSVHYGTHTCTRLHIAFGNMWGC